MDGLVNPELVLKYVQALAWPVVVLLLVWLWRKQLGNAMARLSRVETPAGSVEFAHAVMEVRGEAEALEAEALAIEAADDRPVVRQGEPDDPAPQEAAPSPSEPLADLQPDPGPDLPAEPHGHFYPARPQGDPGGLWAAAFNRHGAKPGAITVREAIGTIETVEQVLAGLRGSSIDSPATLIEAGYVMLSHGAQVAEQSLFGRVASNQPRPFTSLHRLTKVSLPWETVRLSRSLSALRDRVAHGQSPTLDAAYNYLDSCLFVLRALKVLLERHSPGE